MDWNLVPWGQFTAASAGWALAAFGMWLVFSGKLVPRSTHDDVIHDRDEWRAESRIKDAQIAEKDQQLRQLAEVGELQKSVLLAVRNAQSGVQS